VYKILSCCLFCFFFIWGFSLALKPLHNYASLDILFYRVFLVLHSWYSSMGFRKCNVANGIISRVCLSNKTKCCLLTLGWRATVFKLVCFIYVMNHKCEAASLAYMICPILTTIFALSFWKKKLSKWQWFAVLISFFSCILLSINHFEDLFCLITAATYALYLVSQRKIRSWINF
jgi:chloramphenicol-sensitive protein RarD